MKQIYAQKLSALASSNNNQGHFVAAPAEKLARPFHQNDTATILNILRTQTNLTESEDGYGIQKKFDGLQEMKDF